MPTANPHPPEPLLELIDGNLKDAQLIGMIDGQDPAVTSYRSDLLKQWDRKRASSLQEFERWMGVAQSQLSGAYRPRTSFRGKRLSVFHVKPLSGFVRWAREIAGLSHGYDFEAIARQPNSLKASVGRASDACLRMTRDLGAGSHRSGGKLVEARRLQPADRTFWIGRRVVADMPNDAACWRDRLGLIHLSADSHSLAGDMLVRVELGVELSASELPSHRWRQHLSDQPRGVWLVRPTLVHFGNQRWVQAHDRDARSGTPQKHGRARDLASPTFASGERELLVVYGPQARFRFKGVELLSGLPTEDASRDNTDECFLEKIKRERSWP